MTKRIIGLAIISTIAGISLSSFFGIRAYHEYMEVNKTGSLAVYSGSTGTLTGYVMYGGSCNQGSMTVKVQYYNDGSYHDIVSSYRSLSQYDSFNDSTSEPGATMLRVGITGLTGRGRAWIQGYN